MELNLHQCCYKRRNHNLLLRSCACGEAPQDRGIGSLFHVTQNAHHHKVHPVCSTPIKRCRLPVNRSAYRSIASATDGPISGTFSMPSTCDKTPPAWARPFSSYNARVSEELFVLDVIRLTVLQFFNEALSKRLVDKYDSSIIRNGPPLTCRFHSGKS